VAETDAFYVGYLPRSPAGLARFTRGKVILVGVVALLLGLVFATVQGPFGPGVFEYGEPRSFEGIVRAAPVPQLLVERPGRGAGASSYSQYLLVAAGKFGAQEQARLFDGRRVRVEGTLIGRDRRTMIEVETIQAGGDSAPDFDLAVESLGRGTYVGEIVDSKCYMGVMKPGSTKVHRACAQRCISGGVPPVLMVRDHLGRAVTFLLTDEHGRGLGGEVLPYVGIPIEITGDVEKHGELLVLASDLEEWILR
jgi:hypothetical protein